MKLHAILAAALVATLGVAAADAQPAMTAIDAHLAAAKKAAGVDFRGLLGALCVAPANRPPPDVTPAPPPPNRANWYTEPAQVFDDLYFIGTKDRVSWVLPTLGRIIPLH